MEDRIQLLVEARGLDKTARRLLGEADFGLASEAFFVKHLDRLTWCHLFAWLTRDLPAEAPARPNGPIIARIVETVADAESFFGLPEVVREVRDPYAREHLIEALRPKMDPVRWLDSLAFASAGSDVFRGSSRCRPGCRSWPGTSAVDAVVRRPVVDPKALRRPP